MKCIDFDRESNPSAIVRVLPVFDGQKLPVAVFVRYHDSKCWYQTSKEYQYPKCAQKAAALMAALHYAWRYVPC